MGKPRRYQFTVLRLLLIITAIAIGFAIAGRLPGSLGLRIAGGVYLALHAAWLVIRSPSIQDNWRVSQRRRLAVIQKDRELAIEVAKRQLDSKPPDSVDLPAHGDSQ